MGAVPRTARTIASFGSVRKTDVSRRRAVILAGLVGLGLLPPVQARGKAAAVLAESLGFPIPRPIAAAVARVETTLGEVAGDAYVPNDPAPAVLLLVGAAPEGKDDPRAVRLARALARSGRLVFVPVLELPDKRFTERDIDRIVEATLHLRERTGEQVVILGFSYGGSFGLIAAADPRLSGAIEQIAVFGAYFDLLGLVQAATTHISVVGDERIRWAPDRRAEEVLLEAALHLVARGDRDDLRAAFEGKMEASALSEGPRAVYDLITNDDPDLTYELAERLAPESKEMLETFSPSSVADHIHAPIIALHSTDDPVTPYAETLRLARALPRARVVTVELFQHVDFEGTSIVKAVPGLVQTWRFTSWMLSSQE